jgi:hypothetical protein
MSWREIRARENAGRARKRDRERKHLEIRGEDPRSQTKRLLEHMRRLEDKTKALHDKIASGG